MDLSSARGMHELFVWVFVLFFSNLLFILAASV